MGRCDLEPGLRPPQHDNELRRLRGGPVHSPGDRGLSQAQGGCGQSVHQVSISAMHSPKPCPKQFRIILSRTGEVGNNMEYAVCKEARHSSTSGTMIWGSWSVMKSQLRPDLDMLLRSMFAFNPSESCVPGCLDCKLPPSSVTG